MSTILDDIVDPQLCEHSSRQSVSQRFRYSRTNMEKEHFQFGESHLSSESVLHFTMVPLVLPSFGTYSNCRKQMLIGRWPSSGANQRVTENREIRNPSP